jgi:microcystin-dependent protein
MAEPFVSEIRMFGFDFAPKNWAKCDGTLINISQNPMLYSLLGDVFGGDGHTTFALPDLRGRVPVHSDGSPYPRGMRAGQEYVTLTTAELPIHTHNVNVCSNEVGSQSASGMYLGANSEYAVYAAPQNLTALNNASVSFEGGGQQHNNMQPSQVVNFCIALMGTYPSHDD